MEIFSALLAICAGNSPVPGEFPAQRPGTWSFAIFFDLRLNKRLSKQSWGWWFETLSCLLWRHGNVKVVTHRRTSLNELVGYQECHGGHSGWMANHRPHIIYLVMRMGFYCSGWSDNKSALVQVVVGRRFKVYSRQVTPTSVLPSQSNQDDRHSQTLLNDRGGLKDTTPKKVVLKEATALQGPHIDKCAFVSSFSLFNSITRRQLSQWHTPRVFSLVCRQLWCWACQWLNWFLSDNCHRCNRNMPHTKLVNEICGEEWVIWVIVTF